MSDEIFQIILAGAREEPDEQSAVHLAFIDFAHPVLELDKDPSGQADFRQCVQKKIAALLPKEWKITSHTLRDIDEAQQADGYYWGGCMTSCHLYGEQYLNQVASLVDDPRKPCLLACGSMQAYCFHRGSSLSMLGLCSQLEPDGWPDYMPGAIKINRPELIKLNRPDPFWDCCGIDHLSLSEYHCHQVDTPPAQWIHLAASDSCRVEIIRKAWDFAPKLACQSHPEHGLDGRMVVASFLKLWDRWRNYSHAEAEMVRLFVDAFTAFPRHEKWGDAEAAAYLLAKRTNGEVFRAWKDGKLVGIALNQPGKSEYKMDLLAVAPWARGRGFGKGLLKRQYRRGRELGYSPDMMTAETRKDTPEIIHLLRDLGFNQESEHFATYGGETSARILWRGDTAKCPAVYWETNSQSALT